MTVLDHWKRLERWFAANHVPLQLRPPASSAAVDQLGATLGRALPADYRASLLLHDGQAPGER